MHSLVSILVQLGATGSGKTYIGCALGMEACKQDFTVRYVRLPELLEELAIARGQGSFKKVLAQWKKTDLLILGEWILTPPDGNGGQRSAGDNPRTT